MQATTTPQVRCQSCGRKLTAAASIARGRGRTCTAKVRKAAERAALAGFKPAQVEKAKELIEQGGIVPLRGRRVFQVVASDGIGRYLTAREACNCPAGLRARHGCYHRAAAAILNAA